MTKTAFELIEYPNRFPLKVMGKHSSGFEEVVVSLVKARCPKADNIEVRRRTSKTARFISLTITFTAYSQKQLEDIYQDLYDCDEVVMSL